MLTRKLSIFGLQLPRVKIADVVESSKVPVEAHDTRLEFTANSKCLAYGQRMPSPHRILKMTALAMLGNPINMRPVLRRLDVEDTRPHIRNSRKLTASFLVFNAVGLNQTFRV